MDHSGLYEMDESGVEELKGPTAEELHGMRSLLWLWLTAPFLFEHTGQKKPNVLEKICEEIVEKPATSSRPTVAQAIKEGDLPKNCIIRIVPGGWKSIEEDFNANASRKLTVSQLKTLWDKMRSDFNSRTDDFCNWQKQSIIDGEIGNHLLIFKKVFYDKNFLSGCTYQSAKDLPQIDKRIGALKIEVKKLGDQVESYTKKVETRFTGIQNGIDLVKSIRDRFEQILEADFEKDNAPSTSKNTVLTEDDVFWGDD